MNTLRYPPNVQWEITTECNHNCIHCYNYWRKDSEKIAGMARFNSEEDYLRLANKIIEQKPVSVVITGGEPLLVFDRIKSSIDLLLQHGIFVSINTNVALLNESIAEYLKERKIGLFVSFPCSTASICDAITDTEWSLSNVVKKLDLAYEKGIPFSTNIVVSTLNLDYVMETVQFLKKRYDVKKVSITRVGKPINSNNTFDKYLLGNDEIRTLQDISVAVSKEYSIKVETSCPYTACSIYTEEAFKLFGYTKICTAGKTSYAIDTDGNVKACPRDSQLYGNILSQDFAQIWESLHKWRDDSYIPEECKTCKALSRCLGGCRVDSFPFTGRMDRLDLISNTENLPIRFEKSVQGDGVVYGVDDNFVVSNKVRYTIDQSSIRASVGRTYIFLTKAMYDFVSSKEEFSVRDIIDAFGVDISTANNVVKTLVFNNIIYKS